MISRVKERKTDALFRQLMRKRQGYTCQRCGEVYDPDNCRNLSVSHYWNRGHENTRFDVQNCDCLCWFPCHKYKWGHGDGRQEYIDFMRRKLGDKGYDLLQLKAHLYKKRDDKADMIILKEMLKEVQHDLS